MKVPFTFTLLAVCKQSYYSDDRQQFASGCRLAGRIYGRAWHASIGLPINLTLEMLGDRWSLIVIRDVTHLGAPAPRRSVLLNYKLPSIGNQTARSFLQLRMGAPSRSALP
jgi:hypothetical protein